MSPNRAFHDAGAEALVHKLATSFLAALQILSYTLGRPLTRLIRTATHAELDELRHGVRLLVVVVGLHQLQHLAILAGSLAVLLAVVALSELDDPNSLSRGAAVLLDHTRLESHGLLEARGLSTR